VKIAEARVVGAEGGARSGGAIHLTSRGGRPPGAAEAGFGDALDDGTIEWRVEL
jgi:hypothetical protein